MAFFEWSDSHDYGEGFQSPQEAADNAVADLEHDFYGSGNTGFFPYRYRRCIEIVSHDDDEYAQLKRKYHAERQYDSRMRAEYEAEDEAEYE